MTGTPQLAIAHATTQDNVDGAPWPPDGNDLWSVVSRANGQNHLAAHLSLTRTKETQP